MEWHYLTCNGSQEGLMECAKVEWSVLASSRRHHRTPPSTFKLRAVT
jgi:hypothetical protein